MKRSKRYRTLREQIDRTREYPPAEAVSTVKDMQSAKFNEAVDAENALMAWGCSTVNSWYKNEHGHVAQNWPFTLLEYWQRTLRPDPDNYQLID